MGALHDRLRDEPDPEARERLKLQAWNARLDQFEGQSVTRGRFTLTLVDARIGPAPSGAPIVTLVVKVVNDNTGKDVTPDDLNPILIRNPPHLVPDPNGEVELEDGTRAREDIVQSTLETLRDLLRTRLE